MVVPNVMANALRLPLLVIFGLLAGAELYGIAGILVALPLLAAGRAIWEFFAERVTLEPWDEDGPVPVEVEVERPKAVNAPRDDDGRSGGTTRRGDPQRRSLRTVSA